MQTQSLEQLAQQVQAWCETHGILPANGQAAALLTQRTIRYYRTLGLVDAAAGGAAGGFTEKHRLQLIAIRLLQARGVPLRRIRELLYGRAVEELEEIAKRGLQETEAARPVRMFPARHEQWRTMPVSDDYLLISRRGEALPRPVLWKISELIREANLKAGTNTASDNRKKGTPPHD